jgi:hypothetical protein
MSFDAACFNLLMEDGQQWPDVANQFVDLLRREYWPSGIPATDGALLH